MRYIGIDYGKRNIGIAISDEAENFAFPHAVWTNDKSFVRKLKELIDIDSIKGVVVGLPLNFKGEDTETSRLVRKFVDKLAQEIGIQIFFENELFTTILAKRIQGEIATIDASSAALILESFLQRRKNKM